MGDFNYFEFYVKSFDQALMDNKPLKRFGQNYLVDKNIIRKFIDAFDPKETDNIIEIGPGRGSITELLLEKVPAISAVEIDNRVIEDLKERFPNVKIINKDFLDLKLSVLSGKTNNLRFIGNIPFNITSPIIFKLLKERAIVKDAVFIVQLEAARRMVAKRGSKDYGILSVILDAFSTSRLCFKISPNVFFPKPKVSSAAVHIIFNKELPEEVEPDIFIKLVKEAFGNRRKTLKNSLKNGIFASYDFFGTESFLSRRAEELSTDDYFLLAKSLCRGNYDG